MDKELDNFLKTHFRLSGLACHMSCENEKSKSRSGIDPRSIKFKGEAVTNRKYTILTIRRCFFVNSHSQTEAFFSFSMCEC